jgi:dihydroxyacetone kinase
MPSGGESMETKAERCMHRRWGSKMKKILNDTNYAVEEMIEGFMAAYGKHYLKLDGVKGIVRKEKREKVGIVIGGGSGHEPLFLGFVGEGLANGVAIGNVFAAPTPDTILEVTKAVDAGKGVLYVYGNYAGDVLNFDMAQELAEMIDIDVKTVLVRDDVASAPIERAHDRRGIAGDVFVIKIAGAAADKGLPFNEVLRIVQKASENTRSIGVALSPGSIPGVEKPTFSLAEDEIELGMGLHGEPGVLRTKLMKADQLVDNMMASLLEDLPLKRGDEVCVLVNGLGATTLMELMVINRRVAQILTEKGIHIYDTHVNNYCTTQEMAGASISLMLVDEELKKFYDAPAYSPYYVKSSS